MSAVVDQLIGSALASATANDNPVAVAFVRGAICARMRRVLPAPARRWGRRRKPIIDCPTLIVTGDEDAVGPPSIAQELADKIGGAKTVILNRCGHWTPIEKSKECGNPVGILLGIPI